MKGYSLKQPASLVRLAGNYKKLCGDKLMKFLFQFIKVGYKNVDFFLDMMVWDTVTYIGIPFGFADVMF